MHPRLKEIETRLAQIRGELTTRAAELKDEEIAALESEVTALQEERAAIIAAAERRNNLLARIATGETVGDEAGDGNGAAPTVLRNFAGAAGEGQDDGDKYGRMEYRKAFMQYVCRGTEIPTEYRADAVSKTTDVGAVIPTTVLNQIVEKLESTGMILALVTRTAYKGGVSIPVSTVKPMATWVNEGKGSDKQNKDIKKDGMITFAYHKLRCAVAVSLEVDTMAISAFESLLINNIVEAMTKALEQAIIDGDGSGKPKGILAETPAEGQKVENEQKNLYGVCGDYGQQRAADSQSKPRHSRKARAHAFRQGSSALRLCGGIHKDAGGWHGICVSFQFQGLCA